MSTKVENLRKAIYALGGALQPVFMSMHLSVPGGLPAWLAIVDACIVVGMAGLAFVNVGK